MQYCKASILALSLAKGLAGHCQSQLYCSLVGANLRNECDICRVCQAMQAAGGCAIHTKLLRYRFARQINMLCRCGIARA